MDVWSIGMTLEESERNIIKKALQFYQYNKTHTAKSLGISLRGLDGKMEKLNIENLRGKLGNEEKENREETNTDKSGKKASRKNREEN